jgi:hypothetical protein
MRQIIAIPAAAILFLSASLCAAQPYYFSPIGATRNNPDSGRPI